MRTFFIDGRIQHMTAKKRFLDLFSDLEHFLSLEFNSDQYISFSDLLHKSSNPVIKIKNNQKILRSTSQLRNLLVHNSHLDMALPSESYVDMFEDLVKEIKSPKLVSKIMVPFKKMFYCSKNDSLIKAVDIMTKNKISNVPIIENRKLVGVFSESSLFILREVENHHLVLDLSDETFDKHLDKLQTDNHPSLEFQFVSRKMNVYDALKQFTNIGFDSQKRTELLFVTDRGKPHEEILGIISAFDLLSLIDDL